MTMETTMRTSLKACALAAMTFAALAGNAHAENKVELKVIKYPELAKTVRDLKGKVIVVDFWADW
jgi:hypothetical protein